jgi:hypothetical protein
MDSRTDMNKAATLNVLETPFCGDLRSNKFYRMGVIPTTEDDFFDASGHTWCYHSQMPIGPDGMQVSPDQCGPGRKCYRSALAK